MQASRAQIIHGNLHKRRSLGAAGFAHVILRKVLATAREQLRGMDYRRHEEKVLKARKKSSDSARASAQLCVRTYLVLAKKNTYVSHHIFFGGRK